MSRVALFPEEMQRVVWFVPAERLDTAWRLLLHHGCVHLAEQRHFEGGEIVSECLDQYRNWLEYRKAERAWCLRLSLPETGILKYETGVLPSPFIEEGRRCGAWVDEEGVFCWAGEGKCPEMLKPYRICKAPEKIDPPPLQLSLDAWQRMEEHADRLGGTRHWVILDGWVPRRQTKRLSEALKNEIACITPAERCGLDWREVPTQLHRPTWLSAFARLADTYGLPAYRELDPVWLFAAGFVLLFGLMFADLGQGLLLAAFGAILRRRFPWALDASRFLMAVGCAAAFFGMLFGSCFAREDIVPALLFHPMDAMLFYLGATIGLGAAFILLGMILRVFNAWHMGMLDRSVWEREGGLGLAFYAGLLSAALGWLTSTKGWAAGGVGLATLCLLILGVRRFQAERSGRTGLRLLVAIIEAYETLSRFFTQTLSFARVAAFTLAHIGLSMALVQLTQLLSAWPWLAWFCFILGNLAITVLEGTIVAVQAMRLHFYEFFSKFVIDGGRPYRPLKGKEEGHVAMAG